ncbi:MAG: efflux RND transporter permease subunit [Patescibacteria group bacterium]|jgi:HAE1 family hydrophobic/amphiphilic exporter-1|nr:efflux RND transporter permease subunit [Patescibacteria group bacterium]
MLKINLHKPKEASLENEKAANMSSDQLYLETLEFKPELRKSWLNFFIVNFRVVILLIIALTAWGLYSFSLLPRESSPEVKIPIAVVFTTYPGASPADVEELLTKKLETSISGIKDVSKITSNSSNSLSAITVEFDARADLDSSLRKLRDEVSNVKSSLPEDANDPVVKEISFDDSPIMNVSLAAPYEGFALRTLGESLQDELEKIPGVREVNLSGGDEVEFEIAYDPQKLTTFNISADRANQIVAAANLAIPAGNFTGQEYSYPIRVENRFFTAQELANTPLMHTADGAIVYLKDIAQVREKAIKKSVYSRLATRENSSQEGLTIQIVKKTGASIVDISAEAKVILEDFVSQDANVSYTISYDAADQIDADFKQLSHDFLLTLILVFAILFLVIGLKEALVAGLAIPLVFFATFGVMLMIGISLNFLSLFSLILALGLLVDDAIVVVSATKQYLRTGKFTPEEAVLLVLNDFKVVLLTTTLTTIWAFLPLLMASGIIGQFIKSIPITVSVTFASSLIIALIINHPLAAILERIRLTKKVFSFTLFFLILSFAFAWLIPNILSSIILSLVLIIGIGLLLRWYFKGGKRTVSDNSKLVSAEWKDDELIKKKLREQGSHEDDNFLNRLMHGILKFDRILPYYEKYLKKLLITKKRRLVTLGVTFLTFLAALSLPALGLVQNEFFPPSDYDIIYVDIEAPVGLRLEETDKIVRQVEERLFVYPEILNFTTLVGSGSADNLVGVGNSSTHLASLTLKLSDVKSRKITAYELADIIRDDLSSITEAKINVESPSSGPPAGAAFEAQIKGDDLQVLDALARDLELILKSIPEVVSTEISLKESPADYTFKLNPDRLELYNLNAAYVGSALRLAISGVEVTTVLRDGEEIKVIARFAEDKIPDLASIQNLQILNLQGQPVFIKDVAQVELKASVETITRINQSRTVILSAGIKGGTNAAMVLKDFQAKIIDFQFPDGYEISYGGENEQNEESVLSIIQAMAIAFLLIIATLIIQFNSFRQAIIVLVTIPLALIGVFFGLAIANINLSFPGLIGILALFGIVVKNAIILVDKINLNIKSGIPFQAAIVDAGKSRLEAIVITSVCTIFGILPITLSNEMWRALGGAVIFGLMLSSFLTLFIVPTLYMTIVKDKNKSE